MAAVVDNSINFSNISSKIGNLLFGRTEGDRKNLSKYLDELNSINYRYPVVSNQTKAILLVNQCCSFIPTDDEVLLQKCSQLLCNLVNRQNIPIEGRTLTVAINWCMNGLRTKNQSVLLDVLKALEALLRINVKNLRVLSGNVIKELKGLITFEDEHYLPEVNLLVLQCLEACTTITNEIETEYQEQLEICSQIFMNQLHAKHNYSENLVSTKILQISIFGLQNVVIQHPEFLKSELGTLLGVIKTFMLYGMKGIDFLVPSKVLPSTLSIPEPPIIVREKKGGKLTKQRKHRSSGVNKKEQRHSDDFVFDNRNVGYTRGYTPANTGLEINLEAGENSTGTENRLKTSDSDFSDTESGAIGKIVQMQGRVRQAALNLFYNVVKHTDKSTVFSYWSSFIPDDCRSGQHNLVICILKDPSPRSRMAALKVLLLLLTTSKSFLCQAESSDKSTSFTPFCVVLGLTLKELHRGLSLALTEKFALVLTQILKCFAALVQATPYHRMSPGLITKVVRNLKPLIHSNQDASVQVTALIVLGCVLASEPVVPETKEAMLKTHCFTNNQEIDGKTEFATEIGVTNTEDIDYVEFVSDEEDSSDSTMPWLLEKCINNLLSKSDEKPDPSDNNEQGYPKIPVPVKLESLQVISAMSTNYFEILVSPYLGFITKALDVSLTDKYIDLRLHAGRAVDFIGQAIGRCLANKDMKAAIPFEDYLFFWQTLLNGSLVDLLQSEQHSILRAVGCDCLGSIGSDIFEKLPRDKQILCVTLLFAFSRDSENSVKAAAIRALGMCVLYPPLRDDPGFVVDTAEAIYSTLKDENLLVRIKASWALGNLSDTLVLNRNCSKESEEIPEDLILKLLQISIKGSSDNDKIKMNTVRALGNLMQLFTDRMMEKSKLVEATEQAFGALVTSCTTGANVKVRWNACYGLGNALKNPCLYHKSSTTWQKLVFDALAELVVSFRNFKVRINAALALSSPTLREHYGRFYFPVWTALLKALENSQHMEDFTEYKHRDHLIEQVCLSLGHLTTLLREDDLLQLQGTLDLYFDILKGHTHKVLERLVPEKSTTLSSASFALNRFSKLTGLSEDQKHVLNCLMDVFVPEV
ncbi:unnamed protein product [Phaedon cochleariae]|uniref:HEAT repeat-containing protein 6 n=1 Tax=Phaedon cochleariae TaxID=80249 RepID=A0A9N9SBR3_PHACE|nr:unnamed protein product [Phaedon cochleariae]